MAEGLATPDGAALAVAPAGDTEPDTAWAEHMKEAARSADTEEHAAPPKRDAEAPYGRRADGEPKKRAGRPRKDDPAEKPRTTGRAKAAHSGAESGPPKDYRPGLEDLFGGIWGVACLASQADAGAVKVATPALVNNINLAGQAHPKIGRMIDATTGATAIGMAVGALVMLGLQIAANHGRVDPRAVAHLGIRSREELEAYNLAEMTRMAEEMQAAQEAAQAA